MPHRLIGRTADFGSVSLGSSPSGATSKTHQRRSLSGVFVLGRPLPQRSCEQVGDLKQKQARRALMRFAWVRPVQKDHDDRSNPSGIVATTQL